MKARSSARVVSVTAFVAMAALSAAFGSEANYRNFVVGERAAGMGGAVVALADSIDACFYNPAGLARTKSDSISLSASLYGIQSYHADSALNPNEDISTRSFVTIPSTIGATLIATPDLVLGASAFIPTRSYYSEVAVFEDQQHYYNFNGDNQTLWIGPSAGYRIAPGLTVGASLFCLYNTMSQFVSLYYGDSDISYARDVESKTFDGLALVGVQCQPTDLVNLGLTLQSPSITAYSTGKYLAHVQIENVQNGRNVIYLDDLEPEYRLAPQATFGVGLQKTNAFALGFDLTYHFPTSYNWIDTYYKGDHLSVHQRFEPTLDVNLGGEYYVYGHYPVRAGFFTSFSSAPDPDVIYEQSYPAHVDLYGLTASVGKKTEHYIVNIGVNYVFGSGEDYGYALNGNEVVATTVSARERQIYAFVNTSYIF